MMYFITHLQMQRLVTSHTFIRSKLKLKESLLTRAEFNTLFGSSETLAWNSQYTLREGDKLLFTDHVAQSAAMAEVIAGTVSVRCDMGGSPGDEEAKQ
jgi:hypothetical protein